MKNLKKLFAVIITVAMLASLMVPALAAEGFQYEDDARKLYGLNLFKGISETEYVPALEDNLIRETGLALMIRAAGKEAEVLAMTEAEVATQLAKVVDANEIADWAKPYVAYAVKNGLTDGIDASILPLVKFAPKLDLSGKEFINFMLKAMGYPATEVAWEEVLTKAAEIGMLSPGEAVSFGERSVINRDIAVGILAGAMTGITSSGITLAQKLVEDGVVSAEAMAEAGYFAPTATPTEAPVELGVESVEALNLKQIQIVYNKPVDEDTAEDDSNYSLDGEYVLQDDGVTVIGTLDTAVANQTTKELTIKNVEDTEGNVIEKTTVEIDFLDMTIPEVLSAEVVGKATVKVTFSEPINFPANNSELRKGFSMKDSSGKNVYVNKVEPVDGTSNTAARVVFYSDFKEGTYTLTVNNEYKDYAGYTVVKKDFTLEVVPDDAPPEVIGYEEAKPLSVTLIFNEDIEIVSEKKDDFYHTNSKNHVIGFGKDQLEVKEGNKLVFVFDKEHKMPPGTVYIYIAKDAIKDLWDNKNSQQIMIPVEIVGDEEPPYVVEVEATSQTELKVTFNEDLDASDSGKSSFRKCFTILDDDGDEVKNIIKSAVVDGKKVTLTLRNDISGDYTLVVEGVKDKYGNEMGSESFPFSVEDKTPPDLNKVTARLHGNDDQTLVIDFDDVMADDGVYSALDLEKYIARMYTKYDESENSQWSVPKDVELADIEDGISISLSDNGKQVIIELDTKDAGYKFVDTGYIVIARVADAAGNKSVALSSPKIYFDTSATVDADKFEAVAKDEIRLTLKAALDDFDDKDFILKYGGKAIDFEKADIAVEEERNSDGNSVIIFRILNDAYKLSADGKMNDGIVTVSTRKQNDVVSRDVYGAKVKFTDVELKDKIAPSLAKTKEDDEYDIKVENDSRKIILTFDEPVVALSGDLAAKDLIVDTGGEILTAGEHYTVEIAKPDEPDNEEVVITLERDYKSYDGSLFISTIDEPEYIKDKSDNILAEIDSVEVEDIALSAEATVKAKATEVSVGQYVYNKIVITFNEEMDVDTLVESSFEFKGSGNCTGMSFSVNNDGDELTITLFDSTNQDHGYYNLQVNDAITIKADVKDIAETPFKPTKYKLENLLNKWKPVPAQQD